MTDPLMRLMREIREAHGISQRGVADCMSVAKDHYRHIEAGRRPLPDLQDGLTLWLRAFEDCVHATPGERKRIYDILWQRVVDQFSHLLDPPDSKDSTDS